MESIEGVVRFLDIQIYRCFQSEVGAGKQNGSPSVSHFKAPGVERNLNWLKFL